MNQNRAVLPPALPSERRTEPCLVLGMDRGALCLRIALRGRYRHTRTITGIIGRPARLPASMQQQPTNAQVRACFLSSRDMGATFWQPGGCRAFRLPLSPRTKFSRNQTSCDLGRWHIKIFPSPHPPALHITFSPKHSLTYSPPPRMRTFEKQTRMIVPSQNEKSNGCSTWVKWAKYGVKMG